MKMQRKNLIGVVLLTTSLVGYGQARFSQGQEAYGTGAVTYLNKATTTLGSNAEKRGYYVGPHILGDTVTMILNKFESEFVYYELEEGAYAVETKKIIKPIIHRAVWRVNKYYKKKVKKGEITNKNAAIRMRIFLSKAIKLKNYYTKDFEINLRKIKKAPEIEKYFDKIKFK